MSFRRMLPFLFLNIIVSAVVVLVILWWWEGRTQSVSEVPQVAEEVNLAPELGVSGLPTPESLPQATEPSSPEEPSGPTIHVVAAGETLGVISVKYDVPLTEIMAANGMDNPNFLSVGQELTIPVAGEPLPTAEPPLEETVESVRPSPIPTEPAAVGEAAIEIAKVIGTGQLDLEAVQIVNNGSSEAVLSGWYLSDQRGNAYEFGQITLFGDGAGIMIHSMAGRDSATDLFWGQEAPLWQSGDLVVLYDATGAVRAEFPIP